MKFEVKGVFLNTVDAAIAAASLFSEALMLLKQTMEEFPHDHGVQEAAIRHLNLAAKNLVDNTSPMFMLRKD